MSEPEKEVRAISFFDQGEIFDAKEGKTKLGRVYEQVAPAIFAEYDRDTKTVGYVPKKDFGEWILAPIQSEAVTKGLVLLPTEAMEYGSEEELLAEIRTFIHKYLDISPEMETLSCFYVLLSWVYDRFYTIPYLRARGDTGSGKSRFLKTIGAISYKPLFVSGAATSAPIFRLLEVWKGTLVIDEADFGKSDATQDIIKILNTGFERMAPVVRCDKENPNEIEIHEVFGTKIIATRYGFADKALESRCLTEIMSETNRNDIPSCLGSAFEKEAQILRNKLLTFRFRTMDTIDAEADGMDLSFLEPRLRQSSKAFSQLIKGKAGLEAGFVTFMKAYQRELIEERGESLEGVIVNAIFELEKAKTFVYTAKDIAAQVNEDRPQNDQLKPRKVASLLKSLGIESRKERPDGETQIRRVIISNDILKKIFRRYVLPDSETDETIETILMERQVSSHPPERDPTPDSKSETHETIETINFSSSPKVSSLPSQSSQKGQSSQQSSQDIFGFLTKNSLVAVTGATVEEIAAGTNQDPVETLALLEAMVHSGDLLELGGRYVAGKRRTEEGTH